MKYTFSRVFSCCLIISTLTCCYYPTIPGIWGYPSSFIVRVETDADFMGHVGSHDVRGVTTVSYPLHPGECYMIMKTSHQGYVRAFITYSNYYPGGSFPKFHDDATTQFRALRGCL